MARILVVEDDPDLSNLVQLRLRKSGHQTVPAVSAADAMVVIDEKGLPDVMVLDVGLPGESGLEFLQRLRTEKRTADLPVLILSARVRQEDIAAGRALDATYLTKPFVASALLSAIERSLPQASEW